jgi:hypothetical protein
MLFKPTDQPEQNPISLEISRRGASAYRLKANLKRRDDVPLNVGAFSVEEILAANRRHDLQYGWNSKFTSIYTNAFRLPETVAGRLPW